MVLSLLIFTSDQMQTALLHISPLLSLYVTVCLRYSFKVPPKLDLHVRPMLGEREVTFTHVTEWIERKLQCEFQVS